MIGLIGEAMRRWAKGRQLIPGAAKSCCRSSVPSHPVALCDINLRKLGVNGQIHIPCDLLMCFHRLIFHMIMSKLWCLPYTCTLHAASFVITHLSGRVVSSTSSQYFYYIPPDTATFKIGFVPFRLKKFWAQTTSAIFGADSVIPCTLQYSTRSLLYIDFGREYFLTTVASETGFPFVRSC